MLNDVMERWLGSYYSEKLASKTNPKQNMEERKQICDQIRAEAQRYIREPHVNQLYDRWIRNVQTEEFHLDKIKILYLDQIYNVLTEERQEE